MKGKQNPKKQNQMEEDQDKKEFSLYNLLNIDRNATQLEIKKSYRILALKFHPDKNQGDPQAKQMFQKIAEAYEILSNESKRKIYDQTGQIDDNQQFEQAYDYYRTMFPKITKDDIIDFEKRYRFGVIEEEDLIAYYEKQKGDIRTILESIPLSKNEDVPRFVEYYETKIREKGIKMWKAFDLTKKKIKLLKDESKEAELEEQKSLQDLNNQIQQRGRNYQNFLSNIEEKYSQKDPVKKKIKKTK